MTFNKCREKKILPFSDSIIIQNHKIHQNGFLYLFFYIPLSPSIGMDKGLLSYPSSENVIISLYLAVDQV